MNIRNEIHPYNLHEEIPDEAYLLIVGTAPPPRFSYPRYTDKGSRKPLDFDFYYGSEDNYMWEFLDNIAEEIDGKNIFSKEASSEECCESARDFLRRHKIWMRDVLQTYQRKERRESSASDVDIIEPIISELTDFRTIFSKQSCLRIVAFTSEQASAWTFSALEAQKLIPRNVYSDAFSQWSNISIEKSLENYIAQKYKQPFLQAHIGEREIEFYILPSPTGRSRTKGVAVRIKQGIYRAVLFSS